MSRSRTSMLLATSLGALALGFVGGAHASSAPAPTPVALVQAVNAFGNAVTHGPNSAINAYATPLLLQRAPAHQVINLFGPVQNPPQRFAFTVTAFQGATAQVTIRFLYSSTTILTDRTTWVFSTTGWKLANVQYVPDAQGRRILLFEAMNGLKRAIASRSDRAINKYAASALLARLPAHLLMNAFQFGNPPRTVDITNVHINGTGATSTLIFRFGNAVAAQRPAVWTYTPAGWKISATGGAGRG